MRDMPSFNKLKRDVLTVRNKNTSSILSASIISIIVLNTLYGCSKILTVLWYFQFGIEKSFQHDFYRFVFRFSAECKLERGSESFSWKCFTIVQDVEDYWMIKSLLLPTMVHVCSQQQKQLNILGFNECVVKSRWEVERWAHSCSFVRSRQYSTTQLLK